MVIGAMAEQGDTCQGRLGCYHAAEDIPLELSERAVGLLKGWGLPDGLGDTYLSKLVGGANNINLVVQRGAVRYVLKMRSMHGAKLTTGLTDAVRGQAWAAALRVAPAVLASSEEGDFLSEFVVGTTMRPEVFRMVDCMGLVVNALKRVHRIAPFGRKFDIFADVKVFSEEAEALGGKLPEEFGEFRRVAERFQSSLDRSGAPVTFLHGDLVPQNIILCDDGVKFVDFDYCGAGLTAADLAILAAQAEFDSSTTERLLRLYDPHVDDSQRARIVGIQFINTLREISWACAAERKVSESTTLFGDWSYDYHRRINEELAKRILVSHPVDELAREMAHMRPGAHF